MEISKEDDWALFLFLHQKEKIKDLFLTVDIIFQIWYLDLIFQETNLEIILYL